jgi:GNAT superfamily N-acetyltransferase
MDYSYEYSNAISLGWVMKHIPQFMFPDLSKKKDRIKKMFCGVIATSDKTPVGLILSTFGRTKAEARIHSYLVHPEHRNRGIGTRLLHELEKNLINEGCRSVDGTFRSHWKSAEDLQKILAKDGWTKPEQDLIIVRGETKKVLKLFMDDRLQLPDGYAFTPFTGLSNEEKNLIREKKKNKNWYPDILDPFIYEDTINPVSSLALKYHDIVIGWVISHLISKDLNEFTSLFIDADHRSFKLAHLLMRETINRVHDHGIKNFLITSKSDNYVMARFLIRHAPHTGVFFTKTFYISKQL